MITDLEKSANRKKWPSVIKALQAADDIETHICAGYGFCKIYDKNRQMYMIRVGLISLKEVHLLVNKIRAINAEISK